jgi:type II secretory pathway component GspD/PulD (secretin)
VKCAFLRVLSAWYLVLGAAMGATTVAETAIAAAQPPQRPMPAFPLTQLDEHALAADLDNRTFTLTFAQPVPVRELLLLLVRGTSLSIVPDPAISGTFIGELKNVTVRQALGLILPPLGLQYSVDGTFIRVFAREAETRIFDINYAATERTGTASVGGDGAAGSAATVSTSTRTDVFSDLASGIRTLLSERATFNVDRKAGLLQVTDFPERLERVAVYLDAVHDRVLRQVEIHARVIEVELNDEKAAGVDWTAVVAAQVGEVLAGQQPVVRPSLTGLRVTDMTKLLASLAAQGKVSVLSNPRLLTLNNEPAIVRTDSLTLSVTPQITPEAITLSLSPIVKAPAIAESDMIARMVDGETLAISGFTRDRETRERKSVGITGGWLGRATVVTRKRIELIILLTPKIVSGVAAQ